MAITGKMKRRINLNRIVHKSFQSFTLFNDWYTKNMFDKRNIKIVVEINKISVKHTIVFFINVDGVYQDNKKED